MARGSASRSTLLDRTVRAVLLSASAVAVVAMLAAAARTFWLESLLFGAAALAPLWLLWRRDESRPGS